jgi:hypothetical protein
MDTVPDSREGWVNSWSTLLNSYFKGKEEVEFDYSQIRAKGLPIKGFGGIASGPEPLIESHKQIRKLLNANIGKPISSTVIADLFNMIASCVVAGNVRRSAILLLGEADDDDFVNLKNPDKQNGEEMAAYRWSSNNSISARVNETDYSKFVDSIAINGEPGFVWLENCRKYGRMGDPPDYKDINVKGLNPCFTGDMKLLTKHGNRRFDMLFCLRYQHGRHEYTVVLAF